MNLFTDERKVKWHRRDQDFNSGLYKAHIGVLSITAHFIIKGESIQRNIFLSYVITNVETLIGIMQFSRIMSTYNNSLDLWKILFTTYYL